MERRSNPSRRELARMLIGGAIDIDQEDIAGKALIAVGPISIGTWFSDSTDARDLRDVLPGKNNGPITSISDYLKNVKLFLLDKVSRGSFVSSGYPVPCLQLSDQSVSNSFATGTFDFSIEISHVTLSGIRTELDQKTGLHLRRINTIVVGISVYFCWNMNMSKVRCDFRSKDRISYTSAGDFV